MKITKTLLKATSIFMLSTALLFSCSDGSDSSGGNTNDKPPVENPGDDDKIPTTPANPTGSDEKTVSSVVLSSKTLSLGLNDETTLTAFINGKSSTDVNWECSDSTIASVNGGKIAALKAGTVRITATSKVDSSKSAYCDVTVEENTQRESTKIEKTVGTSPVAIDYSYTGNGATIYLYSQSGGLNFYGIKVGDKLWNVKDFASSNSTISETKNLTSNGITFTGLVANEDTMAIDTNSKTISGVSFSNRLKTSGGGSQTSRALKISVTSATNFTIYACSSSGTDSRAMIIEVVDDNANSVTIVRPVSISLNKSSASLTIDDDNLAPTVTLTATVSPSNVTSGYGTVSWISSDTSVATVAGGVVTAVGAGSTTIIASTSNGKSVTASVSVADERTVKYILASDTPDGWAGTQSTTGGYGAAAANIYTVTNYKEFTDALKAGSTKKIIYVSGTIDLNGNQTPYDYIKNAGLDSKYSSYEDYRTKFLATCNFDSVSSLASDQSKLHNAQAAQAIIAIPSNTTILGLGTDAGFSGGNLSIKDVSNVVVRNVKIWDSLDFFPPWYQSSENNFNADMDCITISGSTNVWIDHCTIGDSAHTYDKVKIYNNGENTELDWVNYDALCDVVNGSNYVTISYNKFMNDDKVGLVGNGDSKTSDKGKLKTTFHHNLYDNVGQRLPRVRFGQVHIFNQYYKKVSSYCIGLGKECQVVSENNYFGGSFNAYSEMTNPRYLTQSGNEFKSAKTTSPSVSGEADWSPKSVTGYTYKLDAASDIPTIVEANAGAGVWTVKK